MKGCILPLHKKGDLWLAKNYWGITLTSIAAKIYNVLLQNRIEPKINNILRKNQNRILRDFHTGHPVINRIKSLMRSYVYWPKMDNEITDMI